MTRTYEICVIPGDGIGKEVIPEAVGVLQAAAAAHGVQLNLEVQPWGADYYLRYGRMMPKGGAEVVARADATLFGSVGSPEVPDTISAWGLILSTRQQLDLYVNLRPLRRMPAPPWAAETRAHNPFRMLIVRENTEGEYAGIGGTLHAGTSRESAQSVAVFTRKGIERIVDFAFRQVRPDDGLLTSVTKSNALPHTMDLWDRVADDVASRYPGVAWERMHVDATAYQMVRAPQRFDVLVASNLFGDILSDLGAGLQGTLGLAASGNVNPEQRIGLFEPIHGSAPDIAGMGIANPLGAIESAAMLLEFLGEDSAGRLVRDAVDATIEAGAVTRDLGGNCSTREVGEEVLRRVAAPAAA